MVGGSSREGKRLVTWVGRRQFGFAILRVEIFRAQEREAGLDNVTRFCYFLGQQNGSVDKGIFHKA